MALVIGIFAFVITARVCRIFTKYSSYFKTRVVLTFLLSIATGFLANLEMEMGILSFLFQLFILCFFWYFVLLIVFSLFNRFRVRSELS